MERDWMGHPRNFVDVANVDAIRRVMERFCINVEGAPIGAITQKAKREYQRLRDMGTLRIDGELVVGAHGLGNTLLPFKRNRS